MTLGRDNRYSWIHTRNRSSRLHNVVGQESYAYIPLYFARFLRGGDDFVYSVKLLVVKRSSRDSVMIVTQYDRIKKRWVCIPRLVELAGFPRLVAGLLNSSKQSGGRHLISLRRHTVFHQIPNSRSCEIRSRLFAGAKVLCFKRL